MKILVFSDSHGNTRNMLKAAKNAGSGVDAYIHLGDCARDADALQAAYPAIPVHSVWGNCDFGADRRDYAVLPLGGKRVLITHGHLHNVKWDYLRLSLLAEELAADACLFGHTHSADIFNIGGAVFMNPGSVSLPRDGRPPSYGALDITGGVITASIVYL